MPWKVKKDKDKYCVVKEDTGETVHCHDTEDAAMAQMRALYANEPEMKAVKFAAGSEVDIEGMLAPYNGPFSGKDIEGEFFSPKTDFVLDWYKSDRPLLYHHGLDGDVGVSVVGRITDVKKTDVGLWMKAQLDAAHEYYGAIKELVKQGKLGLSSGSMRHLVRTDKSSGEILRWPLVEGSLTPTPANPLADVDFVTAKSHYKAIGVDLPETLKVLQAGDDTAGGFATGDDTGDLVEKKATLDAAAEDRLDADDYAYVDSKGGRHLPIHDEAHAKNALARFGQTDFESDAAKKKAWKRVLAACEKFGIEVSDKEMPMKMGMAAMQKMCVEMCKKMGIEMSDAEMKEMLGDMADTPDDEVMAAMSKKLSAHKSYKASAEDALEELADYVVGLTSFTDDELDEMDDDTLDSIIYVMDALLEESAAKAGGHAGHGGAHAGHGGAAGAGGGEMPKEKPARPKVMNIGKWTFTQDPVTNRWNKEKNPKILAAEKKAKEKIKAEAKADREAMRDKVKQLKKLAIDPNKPASAEERDILIQQMEIVARQYKRKQASRKSIKAMHGSFEELQEKLQHALNPQHPFECVDKYSYVQATFPDHAIVCRHCNGEMTYWRVEYTINDDGDPVIGECSEVEQAYVPAEAKAGPLIIQADTIIRYAAAFAERTQDLRERRDKEGRILSNANRKRIKECMDAMDACMAGLRDLYDSTEPQPAKAASVRRQFEMFELWATSIN